MHVQVLKRIFGDEATAQASVQTIQQEIERLASMLPIAMSICALEPRGRRALSLRSVVESAVDEPSRKRVCIEPGSWPDVEGDERLLVLAVRQLIANALEATGDDGSVRIAAEPAQDGTVALTVRDSGPGFALKNPAAVVRLMAGAKAGHTGIGLLVAQRVARLHGGSLRFETANGGVVRLVLPVAAPR